MEIIMNCLFPCFFSITSLQFNACMDHYPCRTNNNDIDGDNNILIAVIRCLKMFIRGIMILNRIKYHLSRQSIKFAYPQFHYYFISIIKSCCQKSKIFIKLIFYFSFLAKQAAQRSTRKVHIWRPINEYIQVSNKQMMIRYLYYIDKNERRKYTRNFFLPWISFSSFRDNI